MIQLINACIFFIGTIWTIIDRVKFEKNCDQKNNDYIALYREHNTLQIVLLGALCAFCICNYFNF